MKRLILILPIFIGLSSLCRGESSDAIQFRGTEPSELQKLIDTVPDGAKIVCDREVVLTISAPLKINRPLTLDGLNARLPEKLGGTQLIVVEAKGVALTGLTLRGNYDSVNQKDRAPLVSIYAGDFRVEDCKFYDSSKDGVEICPKPDAGDLVGGTIRNIEAFRIGRDAVSITGGNLGHKVRDVTVENVSLKKGFLRGAVEVSDGTDNITVRGVYAEQCPYAIDVQDHRGKSASNTNILIEDVTAVDCKHIIRTANSPRGHAKLTLKNFMGTRCEAPVVISNTDGVTIEGLKIAEHTSKKNPPVRIKNCTQVVITKTDIETKHFAETAVQSN